MHVICISKLVLYNISWNSYLYHCINMLSYTDSSEYKLIINNFLQLTADHDFAGPTHVLGNIWGKLCKESFAHSSSCSVHSQVVQVSTFPCWSVSKWLHIWVSMGEFCYKSSHFCVVWSCCGVMLVPLWLTGGWRSLLHRKLFIELFFLFLSFPFPSVSGSSSRLYPNCLVMHLYKCLVVEVSMIPFQQELLPSIKEGMQA